MNIELDGLREGEKFPFTSGHIIREIENKATDIRKMRDNIKAGLKEIPNILFADLVSNCCGRPIIEDTDLCSECNNHSEPINREDF